MIAVITFIKLLLKCAQGYFIVLATVGQGFNYSYQYRVTNSKWPVHQQQLYFMKVELKYIFICEFKMKQNVMKLLSSQFVIAWIICQVL